MKRSTPIKYTANTSRYNIRSKSDKPSGRKDTGGFFFYTYLRFADFLSRLFALRRKRQSMIKLPCNKCNGCVSSSSHRLKSAGALLMQLCPSKSLTREKASFSPFLAIKICFFEKNALILYSLSLCGRMRQ